MNCKCGCGRVIIANGKGRPGEFFSGACRVRSHRQQVTQLELIHVTKVSEPVTKVPLLTSLQSELLVIGQTIGYQRVVLASSWGGLHIPLGLEGWMRYALTEKEYLSLVVQRLPIYAGHLIKAGLSGVMSEVDVPATAKVEVVK